jgi:hypothetical protein
MYRLLCIVDVLLNRTESLAISNDPPSVLTIASAKEISNVEQYMDYYVIKASQTYSDMLCVCMSRSRVYMATFARQNWAGVNIAGYVGERVEQILRRADQLTAVLTVLNQTHHKTLKLEILKSTSYLLFIRAV